MLKKNNSYKGGSEEFRGFIRLSSNENSYGPANSVISQIKKMQDFQIFILKLIVNHLLKKYLSIII
jgi:histidinol-phosphate/aromatic aminotransferase/cobyric acid decarboxylase-like protein